MRLRRSVVVRTDPEAVFHLVSDPDRYRDFAAGITRWDPRSKRRRGKGARFKVLMRVGSIEAGGLIRITEWRPGRLIEWASEQGVEHRGRWELRPAAEGTELAMELDYHLAGPAAALVERMAGRAIGRNMEASLLAVRRLLERELPPRAEEAPTRPPSAGRSTVERVRSEAIRSLELAHPRALRTLWRAGVLTPAEGVAVARAWPWYLGRGPSLGVVGRLNAVAVGGRDAIRDRRGSLTWAELDERANRLVHVLAEHGVRPGDRVAMLLRNGREFVETVLACQKVGIVAAPLNTWAKPAELRATLEGAAPSLLVYDALQADQVLEGVPDPNLPTLVVGPADRPPRGAVPYEQALAGASAAPPGPVPGDRGSARIVIHTSGTTGKPKGAARDAAGMGLREFVGLLDAVPLRRDDVIVVPAPLFHSFGLLMLSLGSVLGATLVLPERFDPEGTLALIEEHRATAAGMVPVMLHRILALPNEVKAKHDTSSIRVVLASGSTLSHDARMDIDRLFPEALHDLYGSTEAGWIAVATPADMVSHPGTVGRPVWGVDVAVYSPDGRELGTGETGEIFVRSAAVFEGYISGEQKEFRRGFVSLGDLGHLDEDGYLYVEGRADDMVVVGGENVYPAEIEAVIGRISGVDDVAVFGVPDPEFGEVLAAFVVGTAEPEQVVETCRAELASFKVPRRVEVVEELPRTSTGKVLKRDLLPLVQPA